MRRTRGPLQPTSFLGATLPSMGNVKAFDLDSDEEDAEFWAEVIASAPTSTTPAPTSTTPPPDHNNLDEDPTATSLFTGTELSKHFKIDAMP